MRSDFSLGRRTKANAGHDMRLRCKHAKLTADDEVDEFILAAIRHALVTDKLPALTDALSKAVKQLEKKSRE